MAVIECSGRQNMQRREPDVELRKIMRAVDRDIRAMRKSRVDIPNQFALRSKRWALGLLLRWTKILINYFQDEYRDCQFRSVGED